MYSMNAALTYELGVHERISFLKADNIAILTHATACAKLHTAHETDDTIKETNSVHVKWCNFLRQKKTSARIDFLQVTQVARSEPSLDFVRPRGLSRAISKQFYSSNCGPSRVISKRSYSSKPIDPKKKNEQLGASLDWATWEFFDYTGITWQQNMTSHMSSHARVKQRYL